MIFAGRGLILLACFSTIAGFATAQEPQYNRDVRAILADNCFRCHGPDEAARQADLRLDRSPDATQNRGGYQVIQPGRADRSELVRRITSPDDDARMPPPDSGLTLRSEEIEILRRWIDGGAEYQLHWAFIPPRRPGLPGIRNHPWPSGAIDTFVLLRLEREGLQPSAPAHPAALIRRVTLDLTGLPPTVAEIDEFQRDRLRDPHSAFDRLVDRLLASPRFGEQMAVGWLDAARYADTNGYFTDNDRTMWPWRDWVIDALNQNMPFDQFTIEQLAGDLLPEATIPQTIATGFNRNHMVNNETGIIEEEFRVEYVADRVDTTATVWMGLTFGCARCHDHKFDPISQQDFYRFFSLFNNVPERGLSGSNGNSAPLLKVLSTERQVRLERARAAAAAAQRAFAAIEKQLDDAQDKWEHIAVERLPAIPVDGMVARYSLDHPPVANESVGPVTVVNGMLGGAAKFEGGASIAMLDSVEFDRDDAFSFGGWIYPTKNAGCAISKIDDAGEMRGFDVTLRKGKAVVNLVHRWNHNAIQVATRASLSTSQWQHLWVTFDGSSRAAGVRIYVDGQLQEVDIAHDNLTDTIRNGEPLRIGRRAASNSFEGMVDDVRLYDRQLSDAEVDCLATSQLVRGIVARPVTERSAAQQRKLREYFLSRHADERLAAVSAKRDRTRDQHRQLAENAPTTMVMRESEKPRSAFVLVRGQYDQPGAQVTAGVPEFLGKAESPPTRLGLARWLVEPSQPLTARVTVNRLWQQLFGAGIVTTADDFGTQGAWPSHPALLDWLAVELIESGWDMKHLARLIVTSATYRQSSHLSPHLLRQDPENRLLARGPRFRMDAEMLRDHALAASGLLVERLGGPSVKPYQPPGLWEDVTYDSDLGYVQDDGESLYRRSVYTFVKRQAPPPNMLIFDAPTRETCVVRRSRTNTPLQALALMNDPTFIEAARSLAEQALTAPSDSAAWRARSIFRRVIGRPPTSKETVVLLEVFRDQEAAFGQDRAAAIKLLSVGSSPRNESLEVSEWAAWTTVASMILCLDEAVTKP